MDQTMSPVEPGDVLDMSPEAIDRRTRQRTRALEQIQDGLADLFFLLQRAHGFQPHRIGELKHPATSMIVGYRYAGNEFTLMIVNAPDHPAGFGTIPIRLTQAVIERDPNAIDVLERIIRRMTHRHPFQVHVDAGMTLLGLESGEYLFGQRSATPTDDTQVVDEPVDDARRGV